MRRLSAPLLIAWLAAAAPAAAQRPAAAVDFNRDIRPILSNHCAKCHGPDAAQRQGGTDGLRLDVRDDAIADLGGYAAIVPGHPEKSELIRRVTSADDEERMPPKETGKKLTPREIGLLTEWIKQGAPYAPHWSYVKPVRPAVPLAASGRGGTTERRRFENRDWPRNAIDCFILKRLQNDGLQPSPEADRQRLIRRVALDLTGLPPAEDDLQALVRDFSPAPTFVLAHSSPEAESGREGERPDWYERYVDKLLASPRYGEHWAHAWLDLARYADSAGYADDPPRTIWPYRDYVIQSLNANKPLDQFTIEQIAGDLLPDPTEEQLIATAFHRNTLTNNEGGTNDEEFRNVAVVDRVNTTMAVWMGTTMACAQCHSHKYDPISQEEYFRFFAFFNNTEDADRKDESPVLSWFTEEQQRRRAAWQKEIKQLEELLATVTPELQTAQDAWERQFPRDEAELLASPESIVAILAAPADRRSDEQRAELARYYLSIAPALAPDRVRLASLQKQLAEMKPEKTVPIMRELPPAQRRATKIQHRGNFLDVGQEVTPGTPASFHPLPAQDAVVALGSGSSGSKNRGAVAFGSGLNESFRREPQASAIYQAPPNRLDLARWLIDDKNPLTARVFANRYWEQLVGIGLVATSEEFGAQGELPSHPELLDWLAVEFSRGPAADTRTEYSVPGTQYAATTPDAGEQRWNVKRLLRLIVSSAAYRQSSRVTPELLARDPDNRLLARGPRVRLSAEMVRDQALAASGLLSSKMYGPPVKPPQPALGVSAAFGSGIDWQPSQGEDRYRRALYTTWRRSNPYPSMSTFDAPNREVCTVRRVRTNTPLQALVTLNDPVYIEAAQAVARRIAAHGGPLLDEKITFAVRVCLARLPKPAETQRLILFYSEALARFRSDAAAAEKMATDPLGPAPPGADIAELAAWTVVSNVLLNLDETLMKP